MQVCSGLTPGHPGTGAAERRGPGRVEGWLRQRKSSDGGSRDRRALAGAGREEPVVRTWAPAAGWAVAGSSWGPCSGGSGLMGRVLEAPIR